MTRHFTLLKRPPAGRIYHLIISMQIQASKRSAAILAFRTSLLHLLERGPHSPPPSTSH